LGGPRPGDRQRSRASAPEAVRPSPLVEPAEPIPTRARTSPLGGYVTGDGNGSRVCPLGYISQVPSVAGGWATCSLCSAGTYSLNPLASASGSSSAVPDCLKCPEGGNCDGGGAKVIFSVGKWEQEGGAYVLKDCPRGFQLVNSTNGNSRGTFSHDRQQCKPCLSGQYILNSNADECKYCPLGWLTCYSA
jgi:hypothetical protein